MKRIFATAALVAALTAGSASAGVSSLQIGGHTVGSLWNKVSVSASVEKALVVGVGGLAAFYVVNGFLTCKWCKS